MSLRIGSRQAHRPVMANTAVQVVVTIACAVIVAADAVVLPGSPLSRIAVLGGAAVTALYLLSRSPRWAVGGMLLVTILGLSTYGRNLGPIDIRVADGFYIGLVGWALVRRRTSPGTDVGQRYLAVFFAALACSLIPLLTATTMGVTESAVALARLVQTFSLVWLIPRVISDDDDRRFLIGALETAIVLQIARALIAAGPAAVLDGRMRTGIGPNANGLVSGTLIVLALYSKVPRSALLRLCMIGLGVLGLVGAKSIGSLTAVTVVVGVAGFGTGDARVRAAARPLRLLLLAVALIAVVSTLREGSLPGQSGFQSKSTNARIILGTAGLRIFSQNPALGVGWQRSDNPEVIGTPQLSDELRAQFEGVRADFFPDENPQSVHNTYVQVLAEAGVIGGVAMVALLLACSVKLRRLVRAMTGDRAAIARACTLVVALTLVWWNDNPLYGAQPESVMVATMIGVLASFPLRSDDQEPPDHDRATVTVALAAPRPVQPPQPPTR